MESVKETPSETWGCSPNSGFPDEWLWTGLWQLSYENWFKSQVTRDCFHAWDNSK